MNRKLYSVLSTVFRNYPSRLVVFNTIRPCYKWSCFTGENVAPVLINQYVKFSTDCNEDIATYEEVKNCCSSNSRNVTIIDVREPEELVETGVLPGSINIPLGDVEDVLKNMSNEDFQRKYGRGKPAKDELIIFSCMLGKRSAKAQSISQQIGYRNVKNYLGGWLEWVEKSQTNLNSVASACSKESITSQYPTVSYWEVKKLKDDPNYVLIDVREPYELKEKGAIPGAINIPLDEVEKTLSEMSASEFKLKYGRDKPTKDFNIIFSCRSGRRSGIAQEKAIALGYKNVSNYVGSWLDWEKQTKEL